MSLGPFAPIPPREKIRRSHINDLRTALTGIQDAYDVAVANGFVGTRGQWLDSLKGEKGDPGAGLAPIGSVETVDDLPDSGNTVGDVRTVDADGRAYRWDGSEWIDVGLFRGPGGVDTELRARVDPGTPGSNGEALRFRRGVLDWWDGNEVLVDDRADVYPDQDVDSQPGIAAAITAAGGTPGLGSAPVTGANKAVRFGPGRYGVANPIAMQNTWHFGLAGTPYRTVLKPLAAMDEVIALDGSGYGVVSGLRVSTGSPLGSLPLVQDVIRADKTGAATGSVHMLHLADIMVTDTDFIRGVSLGYNSGSEDMAQVFADRIAISGGWTAGETTKWQRGVSFGSGIAGNVLNMTLRNAQLGGCRYPVYVDNTLVTLRDVFVDRGEYAVAGNARGSLVLDGFRVEECDGLLALTGINAGPAHVTIRNGWYAHQQSAANRAVHMERAGNLTLESVYWSNGAYAPGDSTTWARIVTGGTRGRVITLRDFSAKETPEQIWTSSPGSGFEWKFCRIVLDGYIVLDTGSTTSQVWRGLYVRTVSANTSVQPYDGIINVDAAGGARTITLPLAKWQGGRELRVRKTDASANAVTISRTDTDTIGGATSITLATQDDYAHVISPGGTDWAVISRS